MRTMTARGRQRAAVGAMLAAGALFAPATAQAPALAMLNSLQDGMWDLRFRDSGEPPRRICVRSGQELIQLKHAGGACNRFVVEDGASTVTVQYTCKGNGYGRTSIRRETPTLVQIDSQGIAGGMPFALSAEGRRVGPCS